MTSLNPYALLTIFVFIGATIRAVKPEKIDPWIGLKTGFSSASVAWLIVAGVCDAVDADIHLWTSCVAAGIAYMGSEVLAAAEKYGRKALDEPWLLISDWMPPALKKILSPTNLTKPNSNDDSPA
ncbi:hypothetical protein F5984_20480 [Rudanella paleaurantiibacter]|uniref:Holin n=1 Tax=Rudanella paleaurantiibacter TaxID=2614655 RepID=A0A7J5TVF3_9BACT|nr:hypothetical protein [Rudanella paleaurantiibacter]KAB7728125.1 hypothetical protein F5984_20480 [Rudanella paleaurantiibacter]